MCRAYATAAARRAGVSAVSILHFKGAAQALITRPDLTAPQDLAGTTLWTPYTSTTHYILLAGLAQAGFDVDEVTLVTKSPAEIIAAWDAGDIDGAACWGNTMQHLLDNEWGGESGQLGRAMIDAATVAQWDFETGNVLGVSDAFLAAHGEDGGLAPCPSCGTSPRARARPAPARTRRRRRPAASSARAGAA